MKYLSTRLWRATATPTLNPGRWTCTLSSHFASATQFAVSAVDGVLRLASRRGQVPLGRPSSSASAAVITCKATYMASRVKQFMASPTIHISWTTHKLPSGYKVVYPKLNVYDIMILLLIWALLAALSTIFMALGRSIKRAMGSWNQKAGQGGGRPRNGNIQYEYSGVKMRTPIKIRDKNISGAVEVTAVKDENRRVMGRRRKSRGVRVADRKIDKYEKAWIATWATTDKERDNTGSAVQG